MRAFVRDRYGSPDVMRIEEIGEPELTPEGVRVRVHATSINAHDWHMLRGKPYLVRMEEGRRTPKTRVLGIDVAGTVETIGGDVRHVAPGDRVYGSRSGAFAEIIVGKNMVPMPDGLTFEQAAAIPVAGQTALQGLRDKGGLQPGQAVLVNGAGGGVGTFAVQIARALGAQVDAVTSTRNFELVASLGADRVFDRDRDDFTREKGRYDLILDIGGKQSLSRLRRALRPDGVVVMVAPAAGDWVGPIFRVLGAVASSKLRRQKVLPFLSHVSRDDLLFLAGLVEAGTLRPVIDRTFGFEQIPDAIRYVEAGNARGKVVITV